jgi:hypothetical protein
MSKFELGVWVTQDFARGWTHVIRGSFADPQFDTRAATDVFCYDQNSGVGPFFATVKNGKLDNGTPVPDGLHKVGGNHTFNNRWTHIVYIPLFINIDLPAPFPDYKKDVPDLLLFYDAKSGVGEFYQLDRHGKMSLLKRHTGWRTTWTQIVAGNFGVSTLKYPFPTNLLFYDATNGTGEFYSVDNVGHMRLIRTDTTWRKSWHSIIPGNFSSNRIDDLLFYDKGAGVGEFYKLDGNSGMTLFSKHENWRKTWQHVVSGQFLQNANFDGLLFFEEGSGTTEFYSTDGLGDLTRIDVDPGSQWRLPWQTILAGNFVPNLGLIGNSSLCTYHPDGTIRYFFFQPATIKTVIDLNGKRTAGNGNYPSADIYAAFTFISINMSAYHRPPASGTILDSSTIRATFPDDATYTGRLEMPNRIRWSNNSGWTKI